MSWRLCRQEQRVGSADKVEIEEEEEDREVWAAGMAGSEGEEGGIAAGSKGEEGGMAAGIATGRAEAPLAQLERLLASISLTSLGTEGRDVS
mmetsp:Transcript_15726/g.34773  ORF Transcript_15726/g.34773 Transcript_15726/m.34773 type:complete len:92 (+) Transcript_15726:1225-1500(+)